MDREKWDQIVKCIKLLYEAVCRLCYPDSASDEALQECYAAFAELEKPNSPASPDVPRDEAEYREMREGLITKCKEVCPPCADYEANFLATAVSNIDNDDCEALLIRKQIAALDAAWAKAHKPAEHSPDCFSRYANKPGGAPCDCGLKPAEQGDEEIAMPMPKYADNLAECFAFGRSRGIELGVRQERERVRIKKEAIKPELWDKYGIVGGYVDFIADRLLEETHGNA